MNNKVTAFVLGFIIFGIAMLSIVLILSRPAQLPEPKIEDSLSTDDLQKAQKQTDGLENFGNLPYEITADQIGRSNPFEPY